MRLRSSIVLSALFSIVVFSFPASADVIGVGLDWREKVFVQEFWKEGKAHYAVFNDSPAAVSLSVHPRKGGAALAGPWKLEPKGFLEVEAAALVGKGLIEFKLEGGKSLGLLDAPTEPPAAVAKEKNPVANVGLNGSGGRQANLWTEQDAVSFAAGGKVELRLLLPTGAGTLMYDAAKLPGMELSSETLDIQRDGDKIKIDLAKPKTAKERHTLVLRFPASTEEKPQPRLVVVDGWLSTPGGGGHGVTRGVIVVPAKK
jgi:hypothetical protein